MSRGSVYLRGSVWWVAYYDAAGKRRLESTGQTDRTAALKVLGHLARRSKAEADAGGALLVSSYFRQKWVPARRRRHPDSQRDDERRIEQHVLPRIGSMPLRDVRVRHVLEIIDSLRADKAPRTVRNIISAASAMFARAVQEELMDANPCEQLAHGDMPAIVDKDPEWRDSAVYTRPEVEALLLSTRVPLWRRIDYAIAALTGARGGERFFLRWRHWDTERTPLGDLRFVGAYNTKIRREKSTKTRVVRHIPVHPVLAMLLREWRDAGWAEYMGREPGPDDLVLPYIRARLTKAFSDDPFRRNNSITWKLLQRDLEALGFRERRAHDFRATLISLAISDGAREEVLSKLTHPSPSEAFSLYKRFGWGVLCEEIMRLRLATSLLHPLMETAGIEGASFAPAKPNHGDPQRESADPRSTGAQSRAVPCSKRSSEGLTPEARLDHYYAALLQTEGEA